MLIKNVYYEEYPPRFEIRRHAFRDGHMATIVFPTEVEEVDAPEGTQYLAKKVYCLDTGYTAGLSDRVESNFDAWLERAKEPEVKEATLADVIEAVNALADIVLEVM